MNLANYSVEWNIWIMSSINQEICQSQVKGYKLNTVLVKKPQWPICTQKVHSYTSHIMQFIQTESYHIIFFMNILYVFIPVFDESECNFTLFTINQDFHVLLCVSSDFLCLQTYNHIPHILSKNVFLHHIIFLLVYIIYVFIECSNESKFVFTFLTLKSRFSFSFNNSSSWRDPA